MSRRARCFWVINRTTTSPDTPPGKLYSNVEVLKDPVYPSDAHRVATTMRYGDDGSYALPYQSP
jgi:hypothetical protein